MLTYSGNTYTKAGVTSTSSTEALGAIAGLSASFSSARVAASSKLDRQAESLKVELAADKLLGADTIDKEGELQTLKEKLSSASSTLSADLDGINQQFL